VASIGASPIVFIEINTSGGGLFRISGRNNPLPAFPEHERSPDSGYHPACLSVQDNAKPGQKCNPHHALPELAVELARHKDLGAGGDNRERLTE